MSYTKKAFTDSVKLSGAKFATPAGKELMFLVIQATHNKTAIYSHINNLDLPFQVKAIQDLIDNVVKFPELELDQDRVIKQVKNWVDRKNITLKIKEGFSLQYPKGVATVKKQSPKKLVSSKANGSKTAATKKANAKTVNKAAKITANQKNSLTEPKEPKKDNVKQLNTDKGPSPVDLVYMAYLKLSDTDKKAFSDKVFDYERGQNIIKAKA